MSIINSEGRRSVGGSPHMCAEEAFAFRTDLTSHLGPSYVRQLEG